MTHRHLQVILLMMKFYWIEKINKINLLNFALKMNLNYFKLNPNKLNWF